MKNAFRRENRKTSISNSYFYSLSLHLLRIYCNMEGRKTSRVLIFGAILGAVAFLKYKSAEKAASSAAGTPTKSGSSSSSSSSSASSDKGSGNKTSSLCSTVKPYMRHAIVFGAGSHESWPARIEQAQDTGSSSSSSGASSPRSPKALLTSLPLTADLIARVQAHQNKGAASAASEEAHAAAHVLVTCSSEPNSADCPLGFHDVVVYVPAPRSSSLSDRYCLTEFATQVPFTS